LTIFSGRTKFEEVFFGITLIILIVVLSRQSHMRLKDVIGVSFILTEDNVRKKSISWKECLREKN
jgi:hypothetical protein